MLSLTSQWTERERERVYRTIEQAFIFPKNWVHRNTFLFQSLYFESCGDAENKILCRRTHTHCQMKDIWIVINQYLLSKIQHGNRQTCCTFWYFCYAVVCTISFVWKWPNVHPAFTSLVRSLNKINRDWSVLPQSSSHKVSLTIRTLLVRQTQLALQA